MKMFAFFYQDVISADELKSFILRNIISKSDSKCDEDHAPITAALISAYMKLADLEEVEVKTTDSAKESLELYQKVYFKVFPEAKGCDGMGWFPDTLTEDGNIPRDIIIEAAQCIGRRDKAEQEAWYAYCRKNDVASLPDA